MLDQNKTKPIQTDSALSSLSDVKGSDGSSLSAVLCVFVFETESYLVPAVLELVDQAGLELTDLQVKFVLLYVYFERL